MPAPSSSSIVHGLTRGLGPTPGQALLGRIRLAVCEEILARDGARIRGLASADPEALARCAQEALSEMRARVDDLAERSGLLTSIATRVDRLWRETRAVERLDDPTLPVARRVRAAHALDRVNQVLGSYESVHAALRPLLREDAHVLEVCAGHGGLSSSIATRAAREQLSLRVTASDLHVEYLSIAQEKARGQRLAIDFLALDALRVAEAQLPPIDVIVCAQALHHFDAGMVAKLFAASVAAARVGVVFMDGCRSAVLSPALAVLGVYTNNHDVVHDGVISLRRFFAVEELALLCGLSQPTGAVETTWHPPAHTVVRCRVRSPTAGRAW